MTTSPGWYPDPQVPTILRWWDGQQWTDRTAAAAGSMPSSGYEPPATGFWASPNSDRDSGQSFLATPPAPKRRRWWVVALAAGLVILLVGGTIAGFALTQTSGGTGPTKQAKAYLGDLADGDWTGAYALLCVTDRQEVSPGRFAESKAAHHPLSFTLGQASISDSQGVRLAQVPYAETSSDAGDQTSTLTLLQTQDGWLVCHPGIDPDQWATVPQGDSDNGTPTLTT